ncbi:hypothetical protein HMPREF3152_06555 [Actinomyces sp. HMSC06A08]|uniref:Uncharacterized protein n=1 Tax=Winkia neuii TaxID=33007 RepID=A0A2I1IPK6_9ACTO|nr:hypothetical protein HMPREF3198_02017 [Winkia neuii]OFJ68902.1 hypothetical protein HMPREF2851_01310 [Actinomyces sp. HMSC064C12]OFK00188.1 hypothetical protein HMPREF2835_03410 [Actinomyces sp. HMSC072A03]OFT55107.1 hypothetical protein HMPREF3152_06555 [Actinomyces sp. HMSC06A08]PKY73035.1 hypothetical protein CYJ19_00105 [Winkia neuii]
MFDNYGTFNVRSDGAAPKSGYTVPVTVTYPKSAGTFLAAAHMGAKAIEELMPRQESLVCSK